MTKDSTDTVLRNNLLISSNLVIDTIKKCAKMKKRISWEISNLLIWKENFRKEYEDKETVLSSDSESDRQRKWYINGYWW